MNQRIGLLLMVVAATLVSSQVQASKQHASNSPFELSFTADQPAVAQGESVLLSWSSDQAEFCLADGDWFGKRSTQGFWLSPPLAADQRFAMKCFAEGNWVSAEVRVPLLAPTTGADANRTDAAHTNETKQVESSSALSADEGPVVGLEASELVLQAGNPVELSWETSGTDSCTAGGAWQGAKALYGQQTLGPIYQDSSFSLTCSGAGGSAVRTVSVQVIESSNKTVQPPQQNTKVVRLKWQPPSENVDGSALLDLEGYIIYYGLESNRYTQDVEVQGSFASSFDLTLAPGTYYVAMRAVGAGGSLSELSNEFQLDLQ